VYTITSILLWGAKKSLYFFVIASILGSAMEILSLYTGIPFGKYIYTNELGPKLGLLPIFIPLLWASLSFYALKVGGKYVMPLLMVALDLSFDPRYSGRLWIWISKTQYYGDPLSNFFGWFLTAAVIYLIFIIIYKIEGNIDIYALIFYYLFGIYNCISDLYVKLYTPALISFLVFTSILIFLLYHMHSIEERSKEMYPVGFSD
jgi:putative membrane protein